MRKFFRSLWGAIFWSYERGSWPYDVMVVVIVLFVLITPRHWFHDQPENNSESATGIVLVEQDANAHTETYRLDGALFGRTQARGQSNAELEEKMHQILSESVENLKGQRFQVRSIVPIHASDGSLQYYQVQVKR